MNDPLTFKTSLTMKEFKRLLEVERRLKAGATVQLTITITNKKPRRPKAGRASPT